jgi:hypothetical protein
MKIVLTFLGILLLMVTFGVARRQQYASESCGFVLQGKPGHPTLTGPDDILPLVYVVEQPDSPIEVVSVDLTGTWLSVVNEQHTERGCAIYSVRNRSDRPVQAFNVELSVSTFHGGGGFGTNPSAPLPPGQTVDIKSCGSGGHGGAPGNKVRLIVSVQSVDFGDCFYRPSVRIPSSLGVRPVW